MSGLFLDQEHGGPPLTNTSSVKKPQRDPAGARVTHKSAHDLVLTLGKKVYAQVKALHYWAKRQRSLVLLTN